jgi:hypothetical protein
MPQKMFMGIAAAVLISAAAQTARTENYRPEPLAFRSSAAEVYSPIHAMTYAVGSNGFSGFFQQAEGKCALTLMLYKLTNSDEDTPDKSPARVLVSIRPGEHARIGSAEGDAIQLSCNTNADTVSVSRAQIVPSQ